MAIANAPKGAKRPRINIELPDENHARLCEMQETMGAASMREVTRAAFRLLDWYLDRTKKQGYSLQLTKDGKTTEVDLGLL
jgi:hypothetical protein